LAPTTPHLGQQLRQARNIFKGRYPISPSGGLAIVDVRDVAKVHAAVLSPAAGLAVQRRAHASQTRAVLPSR
jgi:hypothetical protein